MQDGARLDFALFAMTDIRCFRIRANSDITSGGMLFFENDLKARVLDAIIRKDAEERVGGSAG